MRFSRGAAPVWGRCRLGCTRWGATWRTRRNCPCAAAMRPNIKLLWPLVNFNYNLVLSSPNNKDVKETVKRPKTHYRLTFWETHKILRTVQILTVGLPAEYSIRYSSIRGVISSIGTALQQGKLQCQHSACRLAVTCWYEHAEQVIWEVKDRWVTFISHGVARRC